MFQDQTYHFFASSVGSNWCPASDGPSRMAQAGRQNDDVSQVETSWNRSKNVGWNMMDLLSRWCSCNMLKKQKRLLGMISCFVYRDSISHLWCNYSIRIMSLSHWQPAKRNQNHKDPEWIWYVFGQYPMLMFFHCFPFIGRGSWTITWLQEHAYCGLCDWYIGDYLAKIAHDWFLAGFDPLRLSTLIVLRSSEFIKNAKI